MSGRQTGRIHGAARALATLFALAASGSAWAAGGPPATKLINVADTRNLEPGVSLWIAQVYNDSFVLFGALTVAVMCLMGLVLGFAFDRGMQLLGLNLGKLEHHE
jgi:hypothetical protein